MQFARTPNVQKFNSYPDYRPFLRIDFRCYCAYCTGHEDEMGGEDQFEIDHYKPKGQFPSLICVYTNLYYSCRGCNKKGAKGEHWPSRKMIKAGYHFFDPIIENPYIKHMRESPKGVLKHKTRVGKYSIKILRLNRQGLVTLRNNRARMRRMLRCELAKLLKQLEKAKRSGRALPNHVQFRLGQIQSHLAKRPVLNALPTWWNQQ
jgi:hypothetical protein